MKQLSIFLWFIACCLFNHVNAAQAQKENAPQIKLYAINCGSIHVSNFSKFSDTGDYDNQTITLADPCFLIVHPKGSLLWDTGLPDALITQAKTADIYHLTKSVSLQDSLKKINLNPADISYVAISHSHFDHMSGLDQFPQSTWILQKAELAYAQKNANPFIIDASKLEAWKTAKKMLISGDYDVFGDGSVKILNVPGHTPGHQALQVNLAQNGVVILSGDLFHQKASYEPVRVPEFNTSRANTLASADRIKTILKNTHGRLIVQHDANDFETLPKFPDYLS